MIEILSTGQITINWIGAICSCCMNTGTRPPNKAAAVYQVEPAPAVPLCRSCLNHWLDNADDNPGMEPTDLQWIPPTPAVTG